LNPIVIKEHDGVLVVREDLIAGGTKARVLPVLFDGAEEYVYASPVYGYAQIALAHAATANGKKALIFCARRAKPHPRTLEAYAAGANVFQIDVGYMAVVQARAREYCKATAAAKLLPLGLDDPAFISELARIAAALPVKPTEVWSAAGSGVLTRALQMAWPKAQVNAVRVGKVPNKAEAKPGALFWNL